MQRLAPKIIGVVFIITGLVWSAVFPKTGYFIRPDFVASVAIGLGLIIPGIIMLFITKTRALSSILVILLVWSVLLNACLFSWAYGATVLVRDFATLKSDNKSINIVGSPSAADSVPESGDNTISFLCRVQAAAEIFYEIHIDGKVVGSGNAIPNSKDKMTHILSATPGDHVVTITAPGYEIWQKSITLSADSKTGQNILAELKKSVK